MTTCCRSEGGMPAPLRGSGVVPPEALGSAAPPEALGGAAPQRRSADAQAKLVRTLNQQEDWHLHTACVKRYMNAVGVHTMHMISLTTPTCCV